MISFTPKSRPDMEAAHRAERSSRPAAQQRPPAARNVRAVLDLGNMLYFTFRGRAYGVPPLPWRAGQRLMTLYAEALTYPPLLSGRTAPEYYAILRQLPRLLWRHCRPVGLTRRLLRRLGLHRNPFRGATDAELLDLVGFLLQRRMTSTVRPLPDLQRAPALRATS